MIIEDENGNINETRCLPDFMPCDCKNEAFHDKFQDIYPSCNEKENNKYGKAYLCVPNHEQCMKAYRFADWPSYTISCMPNEQPDECENETWIELGKYTEENSYGNPIDDCAKMLARTEKFLGSGALNEI